MTSLEHVRAKLKENAKNIDSDGTGNLKIVLRLQQDSAADTRIDKSSTGGALPSSVGAGFGQSITTPPRASGATASRIVEVQTATIRALTPAAVPFKASAFGGSGAFGATAHGLVGGFSAGFGSPATGGAFGITSTGGGFGSPATGGALGASPAGGGLATEAAADEAAGKAVDVIAARSQTFSEVPNILIELQKEEHGDQEKQVACRRMLSLTPSVEDSEYCELEKSASSVDESPRPSYDTVQKQYSALVNLGVIEVLLKVLELHSSSAPLVVSVCKILTALCRCLSGKAKMISEGGLRCILNVMEAHPAIPDVHVAACGLLSYIVESPATDDLRKLAAIAASSIEANQKNFGVVRVVCKVIRQIGTTVWASSADEMTKKWRAKLVGVILEALQEHSMDSTLLSEAFSALCNQMVIASNIQSCKAIDCIMLAMQKHRTDSSVQEAACNLLLILGGNDKVVMRINAAGGCRIITAATSAPNATKSTKDNGKKLVAQLQAAQSKVDNNRAKHSVVCSQVKFK